MGNLFSKEPEINIIIGPMLSGKTTEMIRIINRLRTLNLRVLVINYEDDKRYSYTHMCTHDKLSTESEFIKDLKTVNYSNYDVICINEGQFFTGLVDFCKEVIKNNKSGYITGIFSVIEFKDGCIILIDGHHRIKALKELYIEENFDTDFMFYVAIYRLDIEY